MIGYGITRDVQREAFIDSYVGGLRNGYRWIQTKKRTLGRRQRTYTRREVTQRVGDEDPQRTSPETAKAASIQTARRSFKQASHAGYQNELAASRLAIMPSPS
jgi:hypothetical protein